MQVICKGVSKTFSSKSRSIKALEKIDLKAEEGEFLCIVGPSGCGKSTLLRIIAGLLKPTSGMVTYHPETSLNGSPVTSMVFQEHGIFPWMNVIDNVSFGLEMQGVSRDERYRVSRKYLEKVGLTKFIRNYPHELSVGMKQRVGLARAFATNTEILLMDEPFGSLDAQTKLLLQEELLRIWRDDQKSVIFVTHDIEEALLLGDRIILMTRRPGRVKSEVKVKLGRPRSLEIRNSKEFFQTKTKIWHMIEEEVRRDDEK